MIGKTIRRGGLHYEILEQIGEPAYPRFYRDSADRGGPVHRNPTFAKRGNL